MSRGQRRDETPWGGPGGGHPHDPTEAMLGGDVSSSSLAVVPQPEPEPAILDYFADFLPPTDDGNREQSDSASVRFGVGHGNPDGDGSESGGHGGDEGQGDTGTAATRVFAGLPRTLTEFSNWLIADGNSALAREAVGPGWYGMSWRGRLISLRRRGVTATATVSTELAQPLHPTVIGRALLSAHRLDNGIAVLTSLAYMRAPESTVFSMGADSETRVLAPDEDVPHCCICMERWSGEITPASDTFRHCGHGGQFCWRCAAQLDICPLCRRPG